jgi:Yip1 domain
MAAMPVTPMPIPPPEEPALSEGARIIDTFIAPSKTFNDVRRNASWWAPWLLISVVTLLFVYAMDRQIGFEQITKNSIAQSSQAEQFEKLPADQQATHIQRATAFTRDIFYSLPIVQLIGFLVIAAVLMMVFNFGAGAAVPFKTSLAIVIYGSLPGIVGAALGIVSLFAGVDPAGFNAQNPVATNPAHFMDPKGNKFFYGMASALDVMIIWCIVLIGIGFACNSKVKRFAAIAIVAGCYLLYKFAGAGIAAAFS